MQLAILLATLVAGPLWAQDEAPEAAVEPAEEAAAEAVDPTASITDEEIEALLGLDEDYSEIEDDDFESSLEVGFGQSIPFPTDI